MSDEISFSGKQYFSSKRASDLSGYSQDYIGQLARAGQVDAKRISGLWYVSLESLQTYKTQASAYEPTPPLRQTNDPESVVSFDGKDYVSASRASKISGYHSDYVTQLARTGVILSRQVGNRWYVDRDALVSHKAQKDALLGAVQSESVGILRSEAPSSNEPAEEGPYLRYINDTGALMPGIANKSYQEPEVIRPAPSFAGFQHVEARAIPIHVLNLKDKAQGSEFRSPYAYIEESEPSSSSGLFRVVIGATLTFVIVLSVGFVSLKSKSIYALRLPSASFNKNAMSAGAAAALGELSEFIEDHLAHQIDYKSSK